MLVVPHDWSAEHVADYLERVADGYTIVEAKEMTDLSARLDRDKAQRDAEQQIAREEWRKAQEPEPEKEVELPPAPWVEEYARELEKKPVFVGVNSADDIDAFIRGIKQR